MHGLFGEQSLRELYELYVSDEDDNFHSDSSSLAAARVDFGGEAPQSDGTDLTRLDTLRHPAKVTSTCSSLGVIPPAVPAVTGEQVSRASDSSTTAESTTSVITNNKVDNEIDENPQPILTRRQAVDLPQNFSGVKGRTIFKTRDSQCFGLASSLIVDSDLVVVVEGILWSVVLRKVEDPQDSNDPCYHLVSFAYVDGIMENDWQDTMLCEKIKGQELRTICII